MYFYDRVEKEPEYAYKERFREEYLQLRCRYEKLKAYNTRIEAASIIVDYSESLDAVKMPKHDSPAEILRQQQRVMGEYLHLLELRAVFENIEL